MTCLRDPRRVAPLVLGLMFVLVSAVSLGPARASVPTGTPTFTNPLNITNRYQPFQPGGVKVYRGTKGKTAQVVVDLYRSDTRTFVIGHTTRVECRILQEIAFENGQLVESSLNFFAQADDGTVYYFGEVVDIYENGVITSHEGSWLVGGPQGSDPRETATASVPTVFMPAIPELGDTFKQEDLFPTVDETDQVVGVGQTVTVEAGRFDDTIQILETSRLDPGTETKWYAPGVGVVKSTAKGEKLELISSTVRSP
jgi:hypothetical protein